MLLAHVILVSLILNTRALIQAKGICNALYQKGSIESIPSVSKCLIQRGMTVGNSLAAKAKHLGLKPALLISEALKVW